VGSAVAGHLSRGVRKHEEPVGGPRNVLDGLQRAVLDVDGVSPRGLCQLVMRIKRRRHPPRPWITFRKHHEVGAARRCLFNVNDRVGDVLEIVGRSMRYGLNDGNSHDLPISNRSINQSDMISAPSVGLSC
jgi:hypothetical protein